MDKNDVSSELAKWLTEVTESPLWSLSNTDGRRIPWREAKAAETSYEEAFRLPGLYLFGAASGRLLYVGQTKGKLWERLNGRYLRIKRNPPPNAILSQCQFGDVHAESIIPLGIAGFPPELVAIYKKRFNGSTVRLEHAVEFARCGIAGIWFAIFPMVPDSYIDAAETTLIRLANLYNADRDFPKLLNTQSV